MDFYRSLLRLGVGGIVIIVMIGVALAPLMPVIVVGCMIITPLIFIAAGLKSFSKFNAQRKVNISRDPRRR